MLKSDFESSIHRPAVSFLVTSLLQSMSAADNGHYATTQVCDFGDIMCYCVTNLTLTCPMMTFPMIGSRFQANCIVPAQVQSPHFNWTQLLQMREITGVKVQAVMKDSNLHS